MIPEEEFSSSEDEDLKIDHDDSSSEGSQVSENEVRLRNFLPRIGKSSE